MFEKLVTFFKRIFRKRTTKLLEVGVETENNNCMGNFIKDIKFDDGKEGKEFIKEILEADNISNRTQEETNSMQEILVEYIDTLIKKIDKCQTDIAIKQVELQKINS